MTEKELQPSNALDIEELASGIRKVRNPTIYEVLRTKLGREPTHAEQCAEVKRILANREL